LEGNTLGASGVDVTDFGGSNIYINAIMDSGAGGGVSAVFGGSGGQWIWGDADIVHTFSGTAQVLGNNTDFRQGSSFNAANLNLSGSLVLSTGAIDARNNFVLMKQLEVFTSLINNAGLQAVSTAGCTITAGAIGNNCLTTFIFASNGGVVEPDTAYQVVGCQETNAAIGPVAVGDASSLTRTGMQVRLVAMSTTATGGGTLRCLITHN
jgi:hypothetical protein